MPQDVNPGQWIAARISWVNTGEQAFMAKFRLDLRTSQFAATWMEGAWVSSIAQAGETVEVIAHRQVPTTWRVGQTIDVKIMLLGIEGAVWQQDDIFRIPAAPGPGWVQIISVTPYAE